MAGRPAVHIAGLGRAGAQASAFEALIAGPTLAGRPQEVGLESWIGIPLLER